MDSHEPLSGLSRPCQAQSWGRVGGDSWLQVGRARDFRYRRDDAKLDDLASGQSAHAAFFFDLSGEMMLNSRKLFVNGNTGIERPARRTNQHGISLDFVPPDLRR